MSKHNHNVDDDDDDVDDNVADSDSAYGIWSDSNNRSVYNTDNSLSNSVSSVMGECSTNSNYKVENNINNNGNNITNRKCKDEVNVFDGNDHIGRSGNANN